MEKKVLLIFTFICLKQVNAQTWVTIPDTAFVTYLHSIVPSAMNGNQMDTSSILITTTTHSINVAGKSISNLSGVQYFTSLTYLNCNANSLISLPVLSNSLDTLDCAFNFLTNLPTLPNTLTFLDCEFNGLHILPVIPNSLVTLYCGVNSLTSLPSLPNSLVTLYCGENYLTSLPTLPNSLHTLITSTNNIACFPTFPDSITNLDLYGNPFNCLPNYIAAMDSVDLSKPLCQAGNSNGCAVATDIELAKNKDGQIKSYPNPANNKITVDATDVTEIKLFEVLGKEITSTKEKEIDVSNLTDGVYFIQVQTNQNSYTQKIIVQH